MTTFRLSDITMIRLRNMNMYRLSDKTMVRLRVT